MKKFKWIAKSNDGAFEDESTKIFDSKQDCYEDMRNHALEKMKWNTEYEEDFADLLDYEYIGYEVKFKQDEIVHTSYSGVYTYNIIEYVEKEEKLSQRLTKQVKDLFEREKQWAIDCRKCLSDMLKEGQVVNVCEDYNVELIPKDSFDSYAERIYKVKKQCDRVYVCTDYKDWYNVELMYGDLVALLDAVHSEISK